jgi:flagellar biogenesis protein FliO
VLPVDPTVKLIELDSEDATRVLSVKLSFDYPDTKAVSRFAQAIQVGDDLHVLVPRKVPADGGAARLPEPTLPPAIAAAVAQLEGAPSTLGPKLDASSARKPEAKPEARADAKPEAKPEAKPDNKPEARPETAEAKIDAKPEAKLDAKPEAKLDAKPEEKLEAKLGTTSETRTETTAGATAAPRPEDANRAGKPRGDGKLLNQALAPDTDDTWSKISMYAALGLAAAGAGLWLMRRRRAQTAPAATIEVIAQRSLGGKARIVWLSAGPREMIVSVTAQQVRVLGQWRKSEATLPTAQARNDGRPRGETIDDRSTAGAADGFASGTGDLPRPVSPAVTGILRLRGRTGQMTAVSEDVASGDVVADELWAKEILAATEARPGARR